MHANNNSQARLPHKHHCWNIEIFVYVCRFISDLILCVVKYVFWFFVYGTCTAPGVTWILASNTVSVWVFHPLFCVIFHIRSCFSLNPIVPPPTIHLKYIVDCACANVVVYLHAHNIFSLYHLCHFHRRLSTSFVRLFIYLLTLFSFCVSVFIVCSGFFELNCGVRTRAW